MAKLLKYVLRAVVLFILAAVYLLSQTDISGLSPDFDSMDFSTTTTSRPAPTTSPDRQGSIGLIGFE